MDKSTRASFFLLWLFACAAAAAPVETGLTKRMTERPDSQFTVWVFMNPGASVDDSLPMALLKNAGFRPRHKSRWFNAVSGRANSGAIGRIQAMPFVKSIRRVRVAGAARPKAAPRPPRLQKALGAYGLNEEALECIGLDRAHNESLVPADRGGEGVRIALFDSGFRTTHAVFSHFTDSTIIAKRDYVRGMADSSVLFDTTVANDAWDYYDQEEHGTSVLSLIAAYQPDVLTGVAPFAQFALIKTEQTFDTLGNKTETVAEEDAWVAAAEWVVDSVGVDIITTSLGYRDEFTDGRADYGLAALNGDSLMITRAADMAAQKGVVVVTSVGNEGDLGPSSLGAPADGDSVIAVGATYPSGYAWYLTSYGPTADGRQKPEISAPGAGLYTANPVSGFSLGSGTSYAAPLAAGVCALLFQARPGLKGEIDSTIRLLKQYAYFPETISPDPRHGAGIVNIYAMLRGTPQSQPYRRTSFYIADQPCKLGRVRFCLFLSDDFFDADAPPAFEIRIYSLSGALIHSLKPAVSLGVNQIVWSTRNRHGKGVGPGIYFVMAEYSGNEKNKSWKQKLALVP